MNDKPEIEFDRNNADGSVTVTIDYGDSLSSGRLTEKQALNMGQFLIWPPDMNAAHEVRKCRQQ